MAHFIARCDRANLSHHKRIHYQSLLFATKERGEAGRGVISPSLLPYFVVIRSGFRASVVNFHSVVFELFAKKGVGPKMKRGG